MNSRIKNALIWLLKLAFLVVPAYLIWKRISHTPGLPQDHLIAVLKGLDFRWLGFAFAALMISNFLGAFQWMLLLVTQGVSMRYKELLRIYFVGLFFNNFLPGNVGGDVKRIYDIRVEGGHKLGAGVSATLFDRVFGLFFLNGLAMAVGLLFFIWDPKQSWLLVPPFTIFAAFCVLFAALFSRRLGRIFEQLLARYFPSTFVERFIGLRNRFHLFRNKKLWLQVTLISAVVQTLRVSVHWFCALSIGLHVSVSWYFYFIPLVAMVSALPISVGGFGPREWLAQYLFSRIGVGTLEAVLVQFLATGVNLAVSLYGGLIFLFRRKKIA